MDIYNILKSFDEFFRGLPLIIGIIGTGLFITIKTKAIQFRKLPFALRNTLGKVFDKNANVGEGNITPFQALSTALAATVGTGNIVGVSLAILLGGPGAIFWMWVAALLGMATKFAEVTLAVAFREKRGDHYVGGPMYYINKGLNKPMLANIFALFAGLATFGIGNSTQANAIAGVLRANFHINPIITGIVLSLLSALVIVGGISSITKVTEKLVPFMSLLYIIGSLVIIIINRENLIPAINSIFISAFNPKAALGGVSGVSIIVAMRAGVARGVFTNEAGLGSSPIAHATATTDHPVRQGLWGISEVFVDTMIICTMTALVILTSGVYGDVGVDASSLVAHAFDTGFTFGRYVVTIGITLFAFSTILGWAYYGEVSLYYLFGQKVIIPYRIIYVLFVFIGANMDLGFAWIIANILNGFMAIPNLIAILSLSGVVTKLAIDFFKDPNRIRKSPAEYEYCLKK